MQPKITHNDNATTQPYQPHPIFSNWNIIAQGWFMVCKSKDLKVGQIQPFQIHGQRLVVFRGEDGKVRALDAYCPHMGTDLNIGKVKGNTIACYFHHWKFDGSGKCVDIPCLKSKEAFPPSASLQSYDTCERYECVWVWSGPVAPEPVAEFTDLAGKDLIVYFDKPEKRTCHQHVAMINGLDVQHLKTVHNINVTDISLLDNESADGRAIELIIEGRLPGNLLGRLGQIALGERYRYGMKYSDGNLGLLTTMKDIPFFGTKRYWPAFHTLFTYRQIEPGLMERQTIFVTERRPGIVGWLFSRLILFVNITFSRTIKDEDGKVYDNMRFSTRALLKMDQPIARFLTHINKLKPSIWSLDRLGRASPEAEPSQTHFNPR